MGQLRTKTWPELASGIGWRSTAVHTATALNADHPRQERTWRVAWENRYAQCRSRHRCARLPRQRKERLPGFNVGGGSAMGRGSRRAFDPPDHLLNPYVPWLRLPAGGDDRGYPPADMNAYALRSEPDFIAATYQPASYSPNSLP
jgi:hypothetical protein